MLYLPLCQHLADHDEDTELELSEALLAEDRKPRWCKKCMAPKPERAHHCSTCGRCILKMDHHCPWLASKCIGHRTYPAFVHFILGITLQAIYIGSISAQAIWYSFEHPFQVDTYTPVHELCLALAGIIFTLVMGSFFLYHVYLILTNQTTLENISPFFLLRHLPELRFPHGDQVRTLSDPPKEHELSYKQRALVKRAHGSLRMYDMGWRRNVAQVFGTGGHYGWVRRLWYGGSSPGDGRQFPRHPRTEQVLGKLAHELVQAEMSRPCLPSSLEFLYLLMSTQIINIRGHDSLDASTPADLAAQVLDGLARPIGERELPTMLLYDERGLRLYDDITTHAPQYYLFAAEEQILKKSADDIVRSMHHDGQVADEVVLELGAGSLRKTSHILKSLSRSVSASPTSAPITYYALDLEENELRRSLGQIAASDVGNEIKGKVETKGMCGTYADGLAFVKNGGHAADLDRLSRVFSGTHTPRTSSPSSSVSSVFESVDEDEADNATTSSPPSTPDASQPPLHILFLGSSIGNFSRTDAAAFIRSLPLRPGSGDTLLLGLDHDNDKELIEEAYNDPKGYTERFIMNGLRVAGRTVGNEKLFDEDKWEYINHYNADERQHEAFFRSRCRQVIVDPASGKEFVFLENEKLKIEHSLKYSDKDAYTLFAEGNVRPVQRWLDEKSRYSLWLLERPAFIFPLLSSQFSCNRNGTLVTKTRVSLTPFGVPSLEDWETLWALWDTITLRMIPPSMLYQKPIDLRHICLFYLGHIPAFLDIHLSRLLQEKHTEPEYFKDIFERGIDPNVDDPTQCHPHSEVPNKDSDWPKLETIVNFQSRVRARLRRLYDDVLSGHKTLTRRMGRVLFMTLEHEAMHAETLLYMLLQRAGTGTLPPPGFSVPQWSILAEAWDALPSPTTDKVVLGPQVLTLGHDDRDADDAAEGDDVQNHEYGWDNESPQRTVHVAKFAIEWRPITNGQFYDFFMGQGQGRVELPASWIMVDGEIQVRTLYGPVPMKMARHWPVMTTYSNLSTYATVKGGRLPTEPELRLFYDKFESGYEGGANYGFRNWHPVPATAGGEKNGRKGSNGGVWEWTSTLFDKYDGFSPSTLYPGYSKDFFDGDHQVVLGGSFATIPRLTERRTVRNWYQRNYPYPWIGARIAYDL
ncbi:hypothetical protein APHAL10511_003388 [Amanita phalloides]|nr:hypothetical protein APHAL10511_003388 [Amanita phalloides]